MTVRLFSVLFAASPRGPSLPPHLPLCLYTHVCLYDQAHYQIDLHVGTPFAKLPSWERHQIDDLFSASGFFLPQAPLARPAFFRTSTMVMLHDSHRKLSLIIIIKYSVDVYPSMLLPEPKPRCWLRFCRRNTACVPFGHREACWKANVFPHQTISEVRGLVANFQVWRDTAKRHRESPRGRRSKKNSFSLRNERARPPIIGSSCWVSSLTALSSGSCSIMVPVPGPRFSLKPVRYLPLPAIFVFREQ